MHRHLGRGQRAHGVLKPDSAKRQHGHRLGEGHLGRKDQRCAHPVRRHAVADQPGVTAPHRTHHRPVKWIVADLFAAHGGGKGQRLRKGTHATPCATKARAMS